MKGISAAQLYESLQPVSVYYDRNSKLSREEYTLKLSQSNTLYVGNLSIYSSEEQIFELFNRIGAGVKRLIMGRNKETGTAIGFCFIEQKYNNHEDAAEAIEFLNLLRLDDRVIRVDWDVGYSEGREFGRGQQGYQVRDSYRREADPERPTIQNNRSYSRGGGRGNRGRGRQDSNEGSESDERGNKKQRRDFSNRRKY